VRSNLTVGRARCSCTIVDGRRCRAKTTAANATAMSGTIRETSWGAVAKSEPKAHPHCDETAFPPSEGIVQGSMVVSFPKGT
jgi:hypothetical protein